ncbi:uncharacterized protein FOMMEDRAFT_30591 [Fomitiporia mediterranea MF3/22]|uniref:uncharacterized protein n=1 Tax=Fomitiporia mediterranea (strain MF3/22) TaxID=694068 RepID=UPI0004407FEC|nr:uncharacterized protein FOMMEDRAFT_30591 [Fomitiporia mediterranea MF3/22]EJD00614.1 hypothetical protein FOMMEDRAFT_30591 [Fomitiporia mediterranea MF3/22]
MSDQDHGAKSKRTSNTGKTVLKEGGGDTTSKVRALVVTKPPVPVDLNTNMMHIVSATENGDAAALAAFIDILQNVNIAKVYDYFLTLDEETFLIWPSRWGVPKVLFFLNRYFPFVDLILLLYDIREVQSEFSCGTGTVAFGFVVAQVILTMRTWAIWGRQTWITILLTVLVLTALVADIFVLTRYLGGVSDASLGPFQAAYTGCPLQFANRFVFVDFAIVMVTESAMLVLLIIKALEHFKHSRSTLMVRMFKDGVIYFIFILCTSIANLVTILSAPVELHEFLIITQRILHSIFCSRVLLHIRGAYTNNGFVSTTTADSQMRSNASGAYYAFRRPLSSAGIRDGRGGDAFELGSVGGVSVMASEVQMREGDDAYGLGSRNTGWGMGYGFDGVPTLTPLDKREPAWGDVAHREDKDMESPISAAESTTSPLREVQELSFNDVLGNFGVGCGGRK